MSPVIAVATTHDRIPTLRSRLADFGLRSLSVAEPSEHRQVVLATLADGVRGEATANALRAEGWMAVSRPLGGAGLAAWERDTCPVTIRDRVSLCLAWSEHPRDGLVGVIELGPGGFGSGHHATTRLIIEALADRIEGGERVLDVGCGSGALALAAIELGAVSAVGVDLKSEAVAATRRNAALNGFADRLEATVAPLAEVPGRFDVVVANVARAGIVALAPQLVAAVAAGGWLAVSGITPAQCESVAGFLHPLVECERRIDGEWAMLVLTTPGIPRC